MITVTACAANSASSPTASAVALQTTTPPATPEPTTSPAEDEPGKVPPFSKERAMHHVRELASDIGVRVRATQGELDGARYIAAEFRSLGYNVNMQKFAVDGGTSRNVVAWWPGAKRYPVIVGGHMDSVPGAPGANDNASGVAVILEVARLMAGRDQTRWVRFVAFGSEEYGTDGSHHRGSEVFVARLGEEGRRRLAGMVSVDMIADGRPLLTGTSGIAAETVARTVDEIGTRIGVDMSYQTTCDCSDNGPFEHAGIPAAYLWSGSVPEYHSPDDTVANMVPEDLMRTGRVVRAFVKALDRKMLEHFRSG